MSSPWSAGWIVAAPLLALGGLAAASGADLVSRPHVLLVMADDQGWAETSYNGHPILKTPNLDAMASGGLRFNRFYAGARSVRRLARPY